MTRHACELQINRNQPNTLVEAVSKILAAKRADTSADVSALEREIDQWVASRQLDGLMDEEIKVVEGND